MTHEGWPGGKSGISLTFSQSRLVFDGGRFHDASVHELGISDPGGFYFMTRICMPMAQLKSQDIEIIQWDPNLK